MSKPPLSQRTILLLTELSRRGIRGRTATLFLRKYAQPRIAQQIDYYDHEVNFRGGLPHWAATPWLEHRIRHDKPAPEGYLPASHSVAAILRAVAYRAS